MSTEQELFDRVAADLDDDAPRAVLADHWLERGSQRGEMVLQQLAGQDARALVRRHETEWLAELAAVTKSRSWQRGFLSEIELAAESAAPDAVWERAIASRELQWGITHLEMAFAADAKTAKLVASSQAFPRMRDVSLGIGEDLVDAAQALAPLGLARTGALPRSGQRFTPKIVQLLMAPVAEERWLDTSNGCHIRARTKDRVLELVITSSDLYGVHDVVRTLRETGIRVAVSLRLPIGPSEPHPLLDRRALDAIRGYEIDADEGWAKVL